MYRLPDIVENGLPIVYIGKLMTMKKRADRERSAFGRRMLEARQARGLTQEDVRKALGIAQSTLSGLEGADQSSSRTVEFAILYGCNPRWLATGEGSPALSGTAPPIAEPRTPEDMGAFVGQLVTLFTQLDGDSRKALIAYANQLASSPNRRWNAQPAPVERREQSPLSKLVQLKESRGIAPRVVARPKQKRRGSDAA